MTDMTIAALLDARPPVYPKGIHLRGSLEAWYWKDFLIDGVRYDQERDVYQVALRVPTQDGFDNLWTDAGDANVMIRVERRA
jgi:hypothetical protein